MMAFAQTLEDELTDLGLRNSQFACKDNSPRSTGQLVSYRPGTFTSEMIFDLLCMIYVDDSAFFFGSRTYTEKGITLLFDHFSWFGLEMHIGTEKNPSKTECIFFLTPGFFNTQTLTLIDPTNPPWTSRKINWKTETHTRGWRIYQVQRNSDNQSERRICHLHQELQALGELHLILSPRWLWHRHTPSSRKHINGSPCQILDSCQRQKSQQVPHIPFHPYTFTPMGMWELGALYIHP